jgi:hypothetical protein
MLHTGHLRKRCPGNVLIIFPVFRKGLKKSGTKAILQALSIRFVPVTRSMSLQSNSRQNTTCPSYTFGLQTSEQCITNSPLGNSTKYPFRKTIETVGSLLSDAIVAIAAIMQVRTPSAKHQYRLSDQIFIRLVTC